MTVMVSTKQTSHVLPIQRYRVTTTMCKDAPPHRVPQVPGPNHSPSPAKGHTHTFLEGALQSPDYQVFCPNALFFHKLGVTGADTVAAEVHGGLHGHHALHHSLQLPAQAGMQGVGSQDSCSWTTMPIKQCPVMACEELLWAQVQPFLILFSPELTSTDAQLSTGCLILIELRFLCIDDPEVGK